MPEVTTLTLNNGVTLPALGLGVFHTPPDEIRDAVTAALSAATATSTPPRPTATSARSARPSPPPASTGPRSSSRPRSGLATTARTGPLHGFDKSARKLGVDQIDLLILHQALPSTGRWRPCWPTGRYAPSGSAT
jgi:hypothetical protein